MALHPVFVHFHTGILAATAALGLIMMILTSILILSNEFNNENFTKMKYSSTIQNFIMSNIL